jgi:type IV pilus biogenesis protein CpaD/CtpE
MVAVVRRDTVLGLLAVSLVGCVTQSADENRPAAIERYAPYTVMKTAPATDRNLYAVDARLVTAPRSSTPTF